MRQNSLSPTAMPSILPALPSALDALTSALYALTSALPFGLTPVRLRPGSLLPHRLRWKRGFGTLEIVIIIAVILSIALLFRKTLSDYATKLISTVFAGDPLAN